MSHHLDTPLASQTGQLYIDDLYVFHGEGNTVFIMDVNSNVNNAVMYSRKPSVRNSGAQSGANICAT